MIGGGALMRYKLRSKTKDIDLVTESEEDFECLVNAFISLGFEKHTPELEVYGRMVLSHILIKDNVRIDLFCKLVCGKFSLSERMRGRASVDILLKNVSLLICSLNDIFLFKCMTEREGDLEDCQRIATSHKLDWNTISDEAVKQSAEGCSVWITWITDRMEELNERGVNIPILKLMRSLADEYIEKWETDLLRN